jgi:hypothetical protein
VSIQKQEVQELVNICQNDLLNALMNSNLYKGCSLNAPSNFSNKIFKISRYCLSYVDYDQQVRVAEPIGVLIL